MGGGGPGGEENPLASARRGGGPRIRVEEFTASQKRPLGFVIKGRYKKEKECLVLFKTSTVLERPFGQM